MKVKLTAPDGTTKNGMVWRVGETNRATGEGCELCTDGVLHFYDSVELAAFMSPIHTGWGWENSRAFEVRGKKVVGDGTKSGAKKLTVIREVEFIVPITTQFVAFGILASKEVCTDPAWNVWADNWLNNKDRSADAARADAARAADAAWAAARADAARAGIDLQACAERALKEF